MSELTDAVEVDRALKARHRAMWAQGDYPAVAAEIIPELGAVLVEACGLRGGGERSETGSPHQGEGRGGGCWTWRPARATPRFRGAGRGERGGL